MYIKGKKWNEAEKKNSYVSAVPTGWNFFSAHPGAWEIHYSIFSFHTQIPILFSALFTLTPAWLNREVEILEKHKTLSPSISFWQHKIIGKTFFFCLWYHQINVSNTNDGVISQKKAIPAARVKFFLANRNGGNIAIFFSAWKTHKQQTHPQPYQSLSDYMNSLTMSHWTT